MEISSAVLAQLEQPLRRVGDGIEEGHTYIESDRMTSSASMDSADQTARAGCRASTTMVVLVVLVLAQKTSSCRSLCMSFLYGFNLREEGGVAGASSGTYSFSLVISD